MSESTRRAVYTSYGVAWSARSGYEVDHLVPLELGGDNSTANLWPEPQDGAKAGYVTKDDVENHPHALVCAGRLPLRTARDAIAGDWYTAYHRYRAVAATRPTPTASRAQTRPTPTPTATYRPSPSPSPPGGGASALCNDGTYSYSAHHWGSCSHHHGVKIFYK